MKTLRVFLVVSGLAFLGVLLFLWLIVPRWIMVAMNSGARMSVVEQFFIILSNIARAPIGIFATLNIFGLHGVLLIWSLVAKRKNS